MCPCADLLVFTVYGYGLASVLQDAGSTVNINLNLKLNHGAGCGVARFCNVDHQKLASRPNNKGGVPWNERHKDICGLLKKWKQVHKGRMSADECTSDMFAFLALSGNVHT